MTMLHATNPTAKPTFAPITRADLKRAAFFNIKLPQVEVTPAVDPDDVEGDPSTWPAWSDEERCTITEGVEPDPASVTMTDDAFRAWKKAQAAEYRPTAGPDFHPDPGDDAERLGLELALAGEEVRPPDDWSTYRLRRFFDGQIAGVRLAQLEFDRWMDDRDEERLIETFGGPIRDRDLYRVGGVS